MMWEYGMGWGWLGMGLFWLAPVLLILAAVKYLFGWGSGREGEKSGKALQVLEERYARGEIGREEYLQKRSDLKQE